MANILKISKDLTLNDVYKLTMSKNTQNLSDCDGQVIELKAWAVYEDADFKTEEVKQILSLLTEEGETLATISDTFRRDFLSIVDLCEAYGQELKKIRIVTGTSKNNRKFVTCELAD